MKDLVACIMLSNILLKVILHLSKEHRRYVNLWTSDSFVPVCRSNKERSILSSLSMHSHTIEDIHDMEKRLDALEKQLVDCSVSIIHLFQYFLLLNTSLKNYYHDTYIYFFVESCSPSTILRD